MGSNDSDSGIPTKPLDSSSLSNGLQDSEPRQARGEDGGRTTDFYTFQAPFGGRSHRGFNCTSCGRVFATGRTIDNHERTCKSTKRTISSMLEESKALWEARKRRRVEQSALQPPSQAPGVQSASTGLSASELTVQNELEIEQNHGDPLVQPSKNPHLPPLERPTSAAGSPTPPVEEMTVDDLNEPIGARKASRVLRVPGRYKDDPLPEPRRRPRVRKALNDGTRNLPPPPLSPASMRMLANVESERDAFGILRTYRMPTGTSPTHDPDLVLNICDLTDAPSRGAAKQPEATSQVAQQPAVSSHRYGPFANKTSFSLADWYWNSRNKSFADFQKLISIFQQPDFRIDDAITPNWREAFTVLGANKADLPDAKSAWIHDDGWKTSPINIRVPFHSRMKDKGVEDFFVGDLKHRSILAVIREKLMNKSDAQHFHYYPYRSTWKPTETSPEAELYGELYASQAFRDAHEEVQHLPEGADPTVERVVVALMLWSDSTHLTSFGSASLWPCYLFFGNESKYRRCKPSEGLCHQIAYFQKMPDSFTDFLKERNGGKMPSGAFFSHIAREVFHAQWSILLDEDLVRAMKNGETGTRPNGLYPCPRCFVPKCDLKFLGAPAADRDRFDNLRDEAKRCEEVAAARVDIFENGYAVDGTAIEARLKPLSLVPIENAFSKALSSFSYSIFPSLVVDLMHEFEIGVWKRLFIHLMRLLESFASSNGPTLTAELDARYRATPSFGRNGIRKFGVNTSSMKRKAARDFEDLLQCAIPAFESLLPEPHNGVVMQLLFICAQWHALAKLRLHNDLTLGLLEYTTSLLGAHMRKFDQETCSKVPTKELAREAEARARREGAGNASGSASRKPASLGMYTIKWHFLGDYPGMIRQYGTTDSYTTEVGELSHRLPKSWYGRTDKKDFEDQMSQIERRQARLAEIRDGLSGPKHYPIPSPVVDEELDPGCRYAIGLTQNNGLDINSWFVDTLRGSIHQDKYLIDFIPKLKEYLLPEVLGKLGFETLGSRNDWSSVAIADNRIYTHKILRTYYTTYDVRREEDVIHVDTPQCNILALNSRYKSGTWNTEHPYLYGRVLGVFHVNASFVGVLPDGTYRFERHRIDVLWVHWYDFVAADSEFALDRVEPAPFNCNHSIGFMNPADVLRGAHLIPQFPLGKQQNVRSRLVKTDDLWKGYYVNRFVDRDMFMRYQSRMSVGHTYMNDNFPPVKVPSLPVEFNFHLTTDTSEAGQSEFIEEEDEPEAEAEGEDAPLADVDDHELMVFQDMYGANVDEVY